MFALTAQKVSQSFNLIYEAASGFMPEVFLPFGNK